MSCLCLPVSLKIIFKMFQVLLTVPAPPLAIFTHMCFFQVHWNTCHSHSERVRGFFNLHAPLPMPMPIPHQDSASSLQVSISPTSLWAMQRVGAALCSSPCPAQCLHTICLVSEVVKFPQWKIRNLNLHLMASVSQLPKIIVK